MSSEGFIPILTALAVWLARMREVATKRRVIPGRPVEKLTFNLFMLCGLLIIFGGIAEFIMRGGSTLPGARGRGCYRALVRARWEEAMRLELPGLAVQAQYGSSAPILRGLGFVEVATIHTLQS